jgi:hypothetical protein
MGGEENAFDSTCADDAPPVSHVQLDGLPPHVRAVAVRVKASRASSAIADLRWRYDLGSAAHVLRYALAAENKPDAVAILARTLSMSPATMRRYARVAEAISEAEFSEYVDLVDRSQMPLWWCHLEELAKCRNKDVRRRCARDVVTDALSVLELAARIRAGAKT